MAFLRAKIINVACIPCCPLSFLLFKIDSFLIYYFLILVFTPLLLLVPPHFSSPLDKAESSMATKPKLW